MSKFPKVFGRKSSSDASEQARIIKYVPEFIHAAKQCECKILEAMLKSGKARFTDRDPIEVATALHWVALNGNLKACQILLKQPGANVNITDGHQCTPLRWAVSGLGESPTSCRYVMSFLLENGADQTVREGDGRTLLHHFVTITPRLEVDKMLPAFRVLVRSNTDMKDADGCTALMLSVIERNPRAVGVFLTANGASRSVYVVDNQGCTPLHHAVKGGNWSSHCLYLLLKHDARIDTKDTPGKTPFDMALEYGEPIFTAVNSAIQGSESEFLALSGYGAQAAFYILDQKIRLSADPESSRNLCRLLVKLAKEANCVPEYLVVGEKITRFFGDHVPGGFAKVQGAYYKNKKVALKKLNIVKSAAGEMKTSFSFIREALIWKHLDHENVLHLIGIQRSSENPQVYVMISPWMEGGSATKYLTKAWNESYYNKWLLEIASGLNYLHQENIIHGDLRADNILMNHNLQIKIADFGLSIFAESTTSTLGYLNSGHYRWLSPELLDSTIRWPTFASDVFSYGRVCMEFYTGNIPFAQEYPVESEQDPNILRKAIQTNNQIPLRPMNMNNALWTLVKETWRKEPDERPNIQVVLQTLQIMS